MKTAFIILGLCAALCGCGNGEGDAPMSAENDHMVLLNVSSDPTVSFRILFDVGSQNDPEGKEGLAALTAELVTGGASARHTYEEITEMLYPMAASIGNQVDKEMTVFSGRTHIDNLEDYYSLFIEVLLEPGFDPKDFERVKSNQLNYVTTTLRYSQDEELGKEALYELIFEGTPYEHNEEGTVAGLESITLDDVKNFYRAHYTRDNLTIGLGGGFDPAFAERVDNDFAALPEGAGEEVPAPSPQPIDGMHVTIIDKNAPATAISFGFPIDVTRGDNDYYALAFATAWLGEHRNSFSHLYEVIREQRGLNYGDYAYVEHFPGGHYRQFPPPNVARSQQVFQVWIRPVPHEARVFAFRAALRELRGLVENGMSREDFELTKKFLKGYILHYAKTTNARLGYALDDRFYAIDEGHWNRYARRLDELTLEEVNAALARHLTWQNIKAVFITTDAEGLQEALVSNASSPITYESEKPAEIIEEDAAISTFPLTVVPENVTIVELDTVFES